MKIINIILYTSNIGKQPFIEWQKKLDTKTKYIVAARLARIKNGNFGDCKPIKGVKEIYEFRVDYGPGYRIYYGKKGSMIVVLLVGGDKGSQNRDILKAKQYWFDFTEQKNA